jgi:chromate reductase
MDNPIRIIGIAGSLRRESYNRAALRAAQQLVPEDAILEIFELYSIPPSIRTTNNRRPLKWSS